jgi:hypothetical protein
MKFRPHRGSLADAMKEMVDLPDRAALIALLQSMHKDADFGPVITDEAVHVEKYGHGIDTRIGWDTHIVMIDDWGPAGFTDGPC